MYFVDILRSTFKYLYTQLSIPSLIGYSNFVKYSDFCNKRSFERFTFFPKLISCVVLNSVITMSDCLISPIRTLTTQLGQEFVFNIPALITYNSATTQILISSSIISVLVKLDDIKIIVQRKIFIYCPKSILRSFSKCL